MTDVRSLVKDLDMGLRNLEIVEKVPSPFIAGTDIQFAWDSTSLGYFKQCPQLYKYIVIDGYQPKDESVHLRFGTEYHKCIADYRISIAAGIKHDDAVFDVIKALLFRIDDWWPDHKYKNRLSLLHAVIGYLDKYQDDPVQVIQLDNERPAVEYSFRFELEYPCTEDQPYILCGHLDDVSKFNADYFGRDHKTTTSTPGEYYWKQFEPNNQMTLYTIATKVVLEKPAKGMIIDSAQILLTDPYVRFTRGITYRTEDQLEEWLFDLYHFLEQAKRYATMGYWPHNDTACNMYGGCRFRDVCASAPQIRQAVLDSDFVKGEPWNPLKPR
jgi:hypothetical protein